MTITSIRQLAPVVFVGAWALLAAVSCDTPDLDSEVLLEAEVAKVEQIVARLESKSGGEYSIWLGQPSGDIWYAHNADAIRPAASAIKSAILIEFFSEQINSLDAPFPALNEILDNPECVALGHFSPEQQAAARAELRGLTPRQLAEAMIHKGHIQSNAAYNAAANVIIEYLGGPGAVTERMHRRFPHADELQVARYMLTDRRKHDDNLLTANSLAAVLGFLAQTPVNDELRAQARAVLLLEGDEVRGAHYYKGGTLTSPPQVRIEAGWWEKAGRTSVYVVIAERGIEESDAANFDELRTNLGELSRAVQDAGIHIRDSMPAR